MDIFTEECEVVKDSKMFVKPETFSEILITLNRCHNSIVVPLNLYSFGFYEIHQFERLFF